LWTLLVGAVGEEGRQLQVATIAPLNSFTAAPSATITAAPGTGVGSVEIFSDSTDATTTLESEEEEFAEQSEEPESPESMGVAFTLLGSLTFGMMLLYLVNWMDDDVRRYSWFVISMTVSIFCAVLLFSGTTTWLTELVWGSTEHAVSVQGPFLAFSYAIFVVWFFLLQLVLGFSAGILCGTIDEDDLDKEDWVIDDHLRSSNSEFLPESNILVTRWGRGLGMGLDGFPVFVRQKFVARERLERRARSWAVILSHVTAFASIRAGCAFQNAGWFATNGWSQLLALIIHQLILSLLFWISAKLSTCRGKSERLLDLYYDQVEESFDDVASLTISFLFCRCVKYGYSGVMSDLSGYQPEDSIPGNATGPLLLFGLSIASLVVAIILIRCCPSEEDLPMIRLKIQQISQSAATNCFAWFFLFGTYWTFSALKNGGTWSMSPNSLMANLLLSVTMSFLAFAATVILDKFEDALGTKETPDEKRIFKNVITAVALLVGLSWEWSFDKAVEVAASVTDNPAWYELGITIGVVVLIIPAWRRYILAKQIYYDQIKEEMVMGSFIEKERREMQVLFDKNAARDCAPFA